MYLLGVKKVQICPFKGTAPVTSCCTPKGKILNSYFSVTFLKIPNVIRFSWLLNHSLTSEKVLKAVYKTQISFV